MLSRRLTYQTFLGAGCRLAPSDGYVTKAAPLDTRWQEGDRTYSQCLRQARAAVPVRTSAVRPERPQPRGALNFSPSCRGGGVSSSRYFAGLNTTAFRRFSSASMSVPS